MTPTEVIQSEIQEERVARPVVGWAIVGAVFAALIAYITIDYLSSDNFPEQVDNGSDDVPTHMMVGVRTIEALCIAGLVFILYKYVYLTWRRERRLGTEALLFFAAFGIIWQDPLYAYTQHSFTYNTAFIDVRSWGSSIPGFMSPHHENVGYPVLAIIVGWPVLVLCVSVFGSWLMGRIKTRWPATGKFGLIMACLATIVVLDIVCELMMLRVGFYTLPGAIEGVTLFHGHHYQYPIYEATFAIPLTLFAALLHFRNDRGETLVERSLNRVSVRGARRTAVRFLAFLGSLNVILLAAYEVPSMLINLHQSEWPQDVVERSYLNPEVCGPETTYACPGPDIPVNRTDSIHIDPQGRAVIPE